MRRHVVGASILVFGVGWVLQAGSPPDLERNPLSGYLESVDRDAGSSNRVRHVEDPGQGGAWSTTLVSVAGGLDPRIAIRSTGESWVVWWRDGSTDEVLWSRRDPVTKEWSDESVLGDPSENNRSPEIAHDGDDVWVAYEQAGGTAVAVLVTRFIDDIEPFGTPVEVGSTTFPGDVNVVVHSEQGHVWVTWVDSATNVGWSEYNHSTETWASVQYESYSQGNIRHARWQIRETVLDN